jgi:hypothetical protein
VKRLLGILAIVALAVGGCADAPDPGDLTAFCSLLQTGSGLTPSPTAQDLERLVLVAPPEVRPTIEALQGRARDFSELLAEDPPDLEALFNARFDPRANNERAALDRYARDSCGIAAARPPATRWTSYLAENYVEAAWPDLVTAQFEVQANSDRITRASLVFAESPEPTSLIEDACKAASAFLTNDGADPGGVRIFVGSVVAIEHETPNGLCQLP